MRILILGNNYAAKQFYHLFTKDNSNIVFISLPDLTGSINFENEKDILDFIEANEIDFVLITDEFYIEMGLDETISSKNIAVFSPSSKAIKITTSKALAKKFIYRLKINSPSFFIASKPTHAIDYINANDFPFAIKPNKRSLFECTKFAETLKDAVKIVNDFFAWGNEKIVIENYIEGKSITVWVISTGYSFEIIGISSKYQNNIAYMKPDLIGTNLEKEIIDTIIAPSLGELSDNDSEYMGIIGFNIIIDKNNIPNLIGFNNFFDDLNVDFFTNRDDLDWLDIFNSTIVGDVFLKYSFEDDNKYSISIKENNNINFIQANTKTNLKKYIKELNLNNNELNEAIKTGIFS